MARSSHRLLWRIAWRNLLRHRKRNLTTALAIALGFAGVTVLGGYMIRMENYLSVQAIYLGHAGHLSIYSPKGLERALADPQHADLSASDQKTILAAIG